MPLPFGIHGLWREICCHLNYFSFIGKLWFLSSALQIFPLMAVFKRLTCVSVWAVFRFILLGVAWLLQYIGLRFLQICEVLLLWLLFPQCLHCLFLLSFRTPMTWMLGFLLQSLRSLRYCWCFFSLLFLCADCIISFLASGLLILPSVPSILLLSPSFEIFLHSGYYVFKL